MAKERQRTSHIVIHCSATKPEQDVGASDIDRWHRQKGFLKIGYHYVIRRDGRVETGREELEIGAHAQGFNSVSLGICMVGGVDANNIDKAENNFTPEQFDTLERLLLELRARFPSAVVLGHRDLPNSRKACPSFDVAAWASDRGLSI